MKLTKILINKDNYNIYFEKGVFNPTATTTFLINGFLKNKKKIYNKNILDLGCGSGIISIVINKKFKKNKFFASDLSLNAFNCANMNFKYHKLNGLVKIGSLFNPWENLKFDFGKLNGKRNQFGCDVDRRPKQGRASGRQNPVYTQFLGRGIFQDKRP